MTASGALLQQQFYDYGGDDRPGYEEWEEYVPGMPFNGNIFLDISDFAGKNIQVQFQSRYDLNDDGGSGTGLFIDDVEIYKVSGGNYPAPTGLTAEAGDGEVTLSWNDMNASGTDDFAFDNGQFDEVNGITINGDGDAWAAERFEFFGPSTVNSVEVYSVNPVS